MRQRWTSKALSDLDGIRDHTRREWGNQQAVSYLRLIQDAVKAASQAPLQAAPADHYRPGYRKIAAGAHLVFFRIDQDAIEIVRILHGAMDIGNQLD